MIRFPISGSALLVCMSLLMSDALQAFSKDRPELPSEAMIVAAHPLASDAGLDVLKKGGSAVDAALCALMVLNVVEPHASGLGGGGFATIHDPEQGLATLDFRECAPAGLDPAAYHDPADSLHQAQMHGGTTVGVPGTARGLFELHERYGSMPLNELLAPAIQLARKGYPVSASLGSLIAERVEMFMTDPDFSRLFLVDGFPPMEGDTLRNPDLALLMEELAEAGLESFYTHAAIRTPLSESVQAAGGWLTAEDLRDYQAKWCEPIRKSYRKWELCGPPPPATGALAVIQTMAILEGLDLESYQEADRLHIMAEAMKQAMRDKGRRAGDPAFVETPIDSMLDADYARSVLARIHPEAIHHSWPPLGSRPIVEESYPPKDHGNTTHLSVWDAHGQVLSLTQSINHFFGAGIVCRGMLLNNQLADFTFVEGSLNEPAPGKRPRSSMAPMLLLQEGEPVICLGTPGGPRIVSAMIEILVNSLDLGMPIQQAIDAPRFHPLGATFVHEPRLSAECSERLDRIGYRLYAMQDFDRYFGGAHGIQRRHSPLVFKARGGVKAPAVIELRGGADPRRDGSVARLEAR